MILPSILIWGRTFSTNPWPAFFPASLSSLLIWLTRLFWPPEALIWKVGATGRTASFRFAAAAFTAFSMAAFCPAPTVTFTGTVTDCFC